MKRKLNSQDMNPIKYKKQKIHKNVKDQVWNERIGEENGKGPCYLCQRIISMQNFHCGHVVSEFNGGKIEIPNLRPICQNCNGSVGTKNMQEFAKEHKFQSKILTDIIPVYSNPNDKTPTDNENIKDKFDPEKTQIDSFISTLQTDESLLFLVIKVVKYLRDKKNIIILCHSNSTIIGFIKKLFNIVMTNLDDGVGNVFTDKSKTVYYSKDIPSIDYVKYYKDDRFKSLIALSANRIDTKVVEKLNSFENINIKKLVNILCELDFENELCNEMKEAIKVKNDYLAKYIKSSLIKYNDEYYIGIKDLHEHINNWVEAGIKVSKNKIVEYFIDNGYDCDSFKLRGYQIDFKIDKYIKDMITFTDNLTDKHSAFQLTYSYYRWYLDNIGLYTKLIKCFAEKDILEYLKNFADSNKKKIVHDRLYVCGIVIKGVEKHKEQIVTAPSFSNIYASGKDPFANFFKY